MKTISRGTLLTVFSPDNGAFVRKGSACVMLVALLGGCTHFESLNTTPDDRIQLTRSSGEIRLDRREARNFTCAGDHILYCRDWGQKLACGCAPP